MSPCPRRCSSSPSPTRPQPTLYLAEAARSLIRVQYRYNPTMLLVDDDDALPALPDERETELTAQLRADGLNRIDENLRHHTHDHWLKVARVVADAVRDGGFSLTDENVVRLHVRRIGFLVESGALEAQGNLRQPRWSEVRTSRTPAVR